MVLAIDGPAGAGKSTVAREVARRLGFTFLDSGAMYRTVAFEARRLGLEPGEIAQRLTIDVGERILVDGRDVSDEIRTPEISEAASKAAADPQVRKAMVAEQRRLLEHGDWVVEGRDIGSVVAPGAEVKVFLTASAQERARRRAGELGADPGVVLAELAIRDERDQTRAHSPLKPAPDATVLDSTELSFDEVVEKIVSLAHQ
jgi:cytidylate kinase